MEQGLSQILARLDRLENIAIVEIVAVLKLIKQEKELQMAVKQSTQDLVDAFGTLSGKITELEALVGQVDDADDEAAKTALLAQIKDKVTEITGHLPVVATAAQTAAQSDADPQASVSA
jgi:Mg2+/Co2+ transporter CorC